MAFQETKRTIAIRAGVVKFCVELGVRSQEEPVRCGGSRALREGGFPTPVPYGGKPSFFLWLLRRRLASPLKQLAFRSQEESLFFWLLTGVPEAPFLKPETTLQIK